MSVIDVTRFQERLTELGDTIRLTVGHHDPETGQACVMDLIAWIATGDKTDTPACVHPIISRYVHGLNDAAESTDDTRRELLEVGGPAMLNTADWPSARAILAATGVKTGADMAEQIKLIRGDRFTELFARFSATTGYDAHSATTGDDAYSATTGYAAHSATTGYAAHSATTGYAAHSVTTGYDAHSATTGDDAYSATTGYAAHSATTGYAAHSATTGSAAHSATTGYAAHSVTTGDDARSATTGDAAHSATTGYAAHSATTGYAAHSATTGNAAHSATTGGAAHSATTGYAAHSATTGNASHSATTGTAAIAAAFGARPRVKAGLNGALIASWHDGKRPRLTVGYTGENDIEAGVWYVVGANGELVRDTKQADPK